MRRFVCLLAGLLLVLPSLGSDAPKEYDGATVQKEELEGTWRLTGFEWDGKTKPGTQAVMTLRGGTYTITFSDGKTWRGNYQIDTTHQPAHLDWLGSSDGGPGKTNKCLYQIHGDTLRIVNSFSGDTRQRPQGVSGHGVYIDIYKRVK